MLAFIPFFIVGIIITAIGFKVYDYFHKIQKLKEVNMDVALPLMKESHAVSNLMKATKLPDSESISDLYELLCVNKADKYQNDPRIEKVLKDYRDLLHGKILDATGKHVPSEIIDKRPNPDYVTYLKAQRKALKLARVIMGKTWFDYELLRLNVIADEEDVRFQYIKEFLNLGIPISSIGALISDEKLNTFKASDWKKLAKKAKEYTESYDELTVFSFLNYINDIDTLLNSVKMDTFNTYISHGAPVGIALMIVQEKISEEQAVRAAKLVDVYKYIWEDAVKEILEDDRKATLKTELRSKYKEIVR